jgi:hypothetical protein
MKKTLIVGAALLALALTVGDRPIAAIGDASVTSAAVGVFPSGTQFNGVNLSGSTMGFGVEVRTDGSAVGDFETVLAGTTLTGAAQNITVEGQVATGRMNPDGSVTFGGISTVDLGTGQVLTNIPFTATVTAGGLQLVLGGTTLPTQSLSAGAISIP